MKKRRKQLKSRNPIARVVTKIRPQIVPDKRRKEHEKQIKKKLQGEDE